MGKKEVLLLWTGGWDSTFRLLQLAEMEIVVKPIYIIDPLRSSREFEINAMRKILDAIKSDKRFRADLNDIKFYEADWILQNCKDEQISRDYLYMHKKYKLGTQYEWIALLCKYESLRMESAILCHSHSKVGDAIKAEGAIVPLEDDFIGGRMKVVPRDGNKVAYNVLGNLILPLVDITKQDEERMAREKGWINIMKLTWFCHSPINGKPCGLCNPCDDAISLGMKWRMPNEALKRHKYRKLNAFVCKCSGILKRH